MRQGFEAVKMRIGVNREHDLERVAACREVLGPEVKLMADAVMGHNPDPWTAAEAVRVAKALEPYDLFWAGGALFCGGLRGLCPCPSEYLYSHFGAVRVRACGMSSNIFLSVRHWTWPSQMRARAGGILECIKISAMADACGVKVAPHAWGTSITVAANLAWAFVTPNTVLAEYPTWYFPLTDALFVEKPRIEDGMVYPPTTPGLGVELPKDLEEKYGYRPEASRLDMRRERE